MTYTPRDACEFPNDNPDLHSGAAWICLEPLAPARAVLRSSLLPRIQAERLTPARPKRAASMKLDTKSEAESSGSTDDVVARLIALVERMNPLAPRSEPTLGDSAQESRRMLTALSLCKPLRIVDNVPAPPAHVYVIDTVPAPPAHVYEKLDLSVFESVAAPVAQADSEPTPTTDDTVEDDSEPMTLRGFELAAVLMRAQEQRSESAETSCDPEQVASASDLDSDRSNEEVALASNLESDNSEGEQAAIDAAPSSEDQIVGDSGVYDLIESGPVLSREQLELELEWTAEERAAHSKTLGLAQDNPSESRRVHDQLDLEFEWVSDSTQTEVAANGEPQDVSVESLNENEDVETADSTLVAPAVALTLHEAQSEGVETAEAPAAAENEAPRSGFAGFVDALVQVALSRGATRAAAIIPNLLGSSQMDASLLSEALVTELAQAKLGTLHDGSFRIAESFGATARAWRELLDGSSEDFSACDSTLDDWGTALLASLLGSRGLQTEIKRELRKRGVAAFGMRAAA